MKGDGIVTFCRKEIHIWISFKETENIYLIDTRDSYKTDKDLKAKDPDNWIEILDHGIMTDNRKLCDGAKPGRRKRIIGETLYKKIHTFDSQKAGKITGMLLEMDDKDLFKLLGDTKKLSEKINEALAVLREHNEANPN